MNQPANELTWKSLGECLAKSRRKQKIDLHDAATTLRLPSRTLLAIEQGSCHDLPTIYLRGHLQRYIGLLNRQDRNLDDLCIDSLFAQQHCVKEGETQQQKLLPAALPVAHRHHFFDRALHVASYVVVTAGVVIPLVWWFTQGAVRMSFDETLVSSPAELAPLPISDGDATEVTSIRPGHLSASAAPFASMRPQRSSAVIDTALVSGDSLLPSAFDMMAAVTESPRPPYRARSEANTNAALPAANEAMALPGSAQLELRMLNDSWVEISDANGARVEFDLLRSGRSHQYQVQLPLDILIGKASAVDLLLDGKPVDLSPHTRGNVAKLELTQLASD